MAAVAAEEKSQRSGGLQPAANRLAGKICVVLGGTGNVGAGVAQAFAAEGAAKVVVTSRSQAKIDAVRAQWGWPESVVGVVGSFGDDAEAAATIESVWQQAGGPVDHCVVSVGFGGMTAPFSEDSADAVTAFLTTHQWPRLRATIQASKRMLAADVPGSSLTMPSGALAAGMHKFPFPGFSGAWVNGVGGALYMQMCNAIACEAKDKKKQLRAHAVVIFPGVSKHGEDKQQMGMPAEPDSSVHLGQGWVAVVLDTAKPNGDSYQFGSFESFDFTDMDAFVAKVFAAAAAGEGKVPKVPATCRAAFITEFKDFNEQDFTPRDVPTPTCGDGMVLVRAHVASINPVDFKIIGGYISAWPTPFPHVPGYDVSGVVAQVGAGVEGFAVGDEVFACNWGSNKETHMNHHADEGMPIAGTLSEYVALPASKCSKKPAGVTHEEAAGVALVGTTAMQAVRRLLGSGDDGAGGGDDFSGKRILVLGGAGAVGHLACQFAKQNGATVYTTGSPRTQEFVQSAGVDRIVNYREVDWSTDEELKQVDAVFDATGEKDSFAKAKRILKQDGAFVSIANFDVGVDPSAHAPLRFASFMLLRNDPADQDTLASMLAAKTLVCHVNQRFEFTGDGIMEAFKTQKAGKSQGKNLIVFG